MATIIRPRKALLIVDDPGEPSFAAWLAAHDGQAFRLRAIRGAAFFQALGPEDEARRTPIDIWSRSPEPLRLISNFAATPFALDGEAYGSVEAFWQGLKLDAEEDRRRIAPLSGGAARDAGYGAPPRTVIAYRGAEIPVGTFAHWQLMERACRAKFAQNAAARDALLGTGDRPLRHRMRKDSRTIPGVIMAEIWMRLRAELRRAAEPRRLQSDRAGPT